MSMAMEPRKSLDENDFPLKVEQNMIRARNDRLLATAETAEVAEQLVERLNQDQNRRQESKWRL